MTTSGPEPGLEVGCPRCAAPVTRTDDGWSCVEHADVVPLWRPTEASYELFGQHLRLAGSFPTLLPWPLGPGWSISDFAVVGQAPDDAVGTLACASGTSTLDGPVDVVVVAEEPGTGLGARVAGTGRDDPGDEVGRGRPAVRVRLEHQVVPLWTVSTSSTTGEWDRSVMVGEAQGRWLWLVLMPASAMLLLRDDWILRDAGSAGPHLVELPFGGPAPQW